MNNDNEQRRKEFVEDYKAKYHKTGKRIYLKKILDLSGEEPDVSAIDADFFEKVLVVNK